MAGFVVVFGCWCGMNVGPGRRRTVGRRARRRSVAVFFFFLRESRNRTDQEQYKNA